MEISLRSQIVAGTAAVVGASAIAMTPALPAHLPSIQLPAATTTSIALAGFDSPITELINSLSLIGPYTFGTGPGTVTSKQGLIPQIIAGALPVIRALGKNGSSYLNNTFNALSIVGQTASEAVWNFPEAVIDSITSLSLTPIVNAILGPINVIGTTLLSAGNYVLQGVISKLSLLAGGVGTLVTGLVNNTVKQVTALVNRAIGIFTGAIGAGSLEGAWNAVVGGTLGRDGLLGVAIKLAISPDTIKVDPTGGNAPSNLATSVRASLYQAGTLVAGVLNGGYEPGTPAALAAAARCRSQGRLASCGRRGQHDRT